MKLHHPAAVLAAIVLSAAPPALAADVAGVKLDDTVKVGGKDLRLNGAGVRTRVIFKVYAMGVYLGQKATTTEAVLAVPGPRRIAIVMMRDVSSDDFGQAFLSGINANSDKAEKSKLGPQMQKLGEVFQSVGNLKTGDKLTVDWVPDKGTVIELNGKPQGEPLPDAAFYNALLKIWLGDKPADASLKPLLLGGKAAAAEPSSGG